MASCGFQESSSKVSSLQDYFCKEGFSPEKYKEGIVCVSSEEIFGPFTQAMIQKCKEDGNAEEICQQNTWEKDYGLWLRGEEKCPLGAKFNPKQQACVEDSSVFGPFTHEQVKMCEELEGGEFCQTNRWHTSFIPEVEVPLEALSYSYSQKTFPREWVQFMHEEIQAKRTYLLNDQNLSSQVKADIKSLCPQYLNMNSDDKTKFWALFMGSVAWPESAWDPKTMYMEPAPLYYYSIGLLQLSYQKDEGHGEECQFPSQEAVKDPLRNLRCGLKIMENQVRNRKKLFTPDEFYYWSVLKSKTSEVKKPFLANVSKIIPACQND